MYELNIFISCHMRMLCIFVILTHAYMWIEMAAVKPDRSTGLISTHTYMWIEITGLTFQ